ncbi:MAG TPA: uroporphyrinogen-III synthase [Gemmatimonadales bacterium]
MTRNHLRGRRILVTRAADDAASWVSRLAAAGALPIALPCLAVEPISDSDTRRRLIEALRDTEWLLLTSPRGARAAGQLLDGAELSTAVSIGVVGPATARTARRVFSRVDLVAAEKTSAGLARELVRSRHAAVGSVAPRVVIAASTLARDAGAAILRTAGWDVTAIAVYRTVPVPAVALRRDLVADGVEVIVLASPSAVTGLLHQANVPASIRIITIGPTTSRAAIAAGLTVAGEAAEPTFEGIVEAIA